MTKPKARKKQKPNGEESRPARTFDEIMGALVKVPPKKRKKKQTG